jgi:hypothetical protein
VCRSIKTLRSSDGPPSSEDVDAAALQFVRKVSGYRQPSKRNEQAFYSAVQEISAASSRLLDSLQTAAPAARR